jgi:hypothetical protein
MTHTHTLTYINSIVHIDTNVSVFFLYVQNQFAKIENKKNLLVFFCFKKYIEKYKQYL